MKRILFIFAVFAAIAGFSATISAQTKQRVAFAKGTSAATFKGTVRGYDRREYVVRASAGQTISVTLNGAKISPVFSVFLPDGNNLEGAAQSNDFSGELPTSGDYVVRVLLMRAYARRNQSTTYTLKISVR